MATRQKQDLQHASSKARQIETQVSQTLTLSERKATNPVAMKSNPNRTQFYDYLWDSWQQSGPEVLKGSRATQYDTDEIIHLRALLEHLPQSIGFLEDREPLRNDAYLKLIEGDVSADRKLVILCGPPASGKSTIADAIAKKIRARIIDSDLAKEFFPEYCHGRFAQIVHEESDIVRNRVLENALQKGENIVVPIIGKSHHSVLGLYNRFAEERYEQHLWLLSCDPKVSATRAVERFVETGRFVDPKYALGVKMKPEQVYEDVKAVQWASRHIVSLATFEELLPELGGSQ